MVPRYLFPSSTSGRAGIIGVACALPWLIFFILYENSTPYTDTGYLSDISVGPIVYKKIYNPACAKYKGDVDSADYYKYTSSRLDFPVTVRYNTTAFLNAKYHFAVNSAPKNFLARSIIRKTWMETLKENMTKGRRNCSASAKFYVGQTSDPAVAQKLHQEMQDHSDIVFIQFCDVYEFLTLKTFNIMRSAMVSQRSFVEWIVKIDDDVLPNFPAFFGCFPGELRENFGIYGWVASEAAIHDRQNKYWVSSQSWNQATYPAYAHGPSYVVRASLLPKLLAAARKTPILNMEDVWFGGILPRAANVKIFDVPRFVLHGSTTDDFLHGRHKANGDSFFYHSIEPEVMEALWKNESVVQKSCDCHQICNTFVPRSVV